MQLGRFEEFDAFGQFAAQMAFGVFQSFFGDVACAVVEDGVEHGRVAVIAGTSTSLMVMKPARGSFRPVRTSSASSRMICSLTRSWRA